MENEFGKTDKACRYCEAFSQGLCFYLQQISIEEDRLAARSAEPELSSPEALITDAKERINLAKDLAETHNCPHADIDTEFVLE